MICYDTIVIGAGPAGLGFCLSKAIESQKILIVEAGKDLEERDSNVPEQVGNGVTGAGAYVDGKFSFFNAGTGLWRGSHTLLSAAYEEMQKDLQQENFFNQPVPPMPTVEEIGNFLFTPGAQWKVKPYPSLYMEIADRMKFWSRLVQRVKATCELRIETRATSIVNQDNIYVITLESATGTVTVYCKNVVLAGGRFMPLQNLLRNISNHETTTFRRFEFGFRVQVPTDNDAIREIRAFGLKDPKLVMSPCENVEYRTFCFCVDGMVSKSCIDGLVTFSGRADVDPTGFTNFAILVRTKSENRFTQAEISDFLKTPFVFKGAKSLQTDVKDRLSNCPSIVTMILDAIQSLFAKFPALNCEQLQLFGPCLEGVGLYPNVDVHMAVRNVPNVYAIGDTNGNFRGLVPSFLSGFYLAHVLKFKQNAPLFVSSSVEKQEEISMIVGPMLQFRTSDEIFDSVKDKVEQLYLKFKSQQNTVKNSHLLIETTSLVIDAVGEGLPGFRIAEYYKELGQELFLLKTKGSAATMQCYFSLVNSETGQVLKQTLGTVRGTIVAPRGANGFGWDQMFVPDGHLQTFAEMELAKKNWTSARSIAANKMFRDLV